MRKTLLQTLLAAFCAILAAHPLEGGGVMLINMRNAMMTGSAKYPWDYRVEYFQVVTRGLYFEAGMFHRFGGNWPETTLPADSDFQASIRNGLHGWQVFSFPLQKGTDQKIVGNYGVFTMYPYSSRINIGGFNSWLTHPTASQVTAFVPNEKTITNIDSIGSDQVQIKLKQGSASWTGNQDVSNKRITYDKHYLIFGYSEGAGGAIQVNQVYPDTRFYETGLDIESKPELSLRFVPCMLGNVPYICEMHSLTMIPSSGSGTITAGPKVPDDWDARTDAT